MLRRSVPYHRAYWVSLSTIVIMWVYRRSHSKTSVNDLSLRYPTHTTVIGTRYLYISLMTAYAFRFITCQTSRNTKAFNAAILSPYLNGVYTLIRCYFVAKLSVADTESRSSLETAVSAPIHLIRNQFDNEDGRIRQKTRSRPKMSASAIERRT